MKKSTLPISEIITIALEKMANKDYEKYGINHTIEIDSRGYYKVSYFRMVRFYIGDMFYTVTFFRYRGYDPKTGYFYRSKKIPFGKYAVTEYSDTFNKYETTRFIDIDVEY